MIAYNIYYKGNKINKRPLSYNAIKQIKEAGAFSKKIDNGYEKYDASQIKIYKCTIV